MNYNEIRKNIESQNKILKKEYENNPSFECLSALRNSMASSHDANKADEGFKKLLTQLYPNKAHYIYELLQNAQDANKDSKLPATVKFTLTENQLEFEHNSKKLFDIKDVESITGLAETTKIDDKTNIGKFGVGFKSVFAITDTPEIISGKYHFIIEKLFIPKLLSDLSGNKSTISRFILPFNNPKKSPKNAFIEIENELHNLGSETLLFLKNINRIEYIIQNNDTKYFMERNPIGNNIIEIKVKNRTEKENIDYWLLYDDNVSIIDEKGVLVNCPISIAFKLQKEENKDDKNNWKIKKAEQGKVCIFFLAEKEDSKLFFYIHAPFASTVARDSIRECDENNKLLDSIAELIAKSLIDIKEHELLSMDFLGILPNTDDNLLHFYEPIHKKIISTFKENPLVPTKNGSFASANELYRCPPRKQGGLPISEIIDDDDLGLLICKKIPLWVKNPPQINQREDRFLDDLKIKQWGDDELSICFNPKNQHDIDKIQNWIASKPDNWLLKLYSLFEEREIKIGDELRKLRIVRTTTDKHSIASETYFPANDEELPTTLNFVKPEVFNKDDTERRMEKALNFLSKLGVKTYNDKEKTKIHIKSLVQKYNAKNPNVSETQHLEDIEYFVKYDESKDLLKEKYFILDVNMEYRTADTICSFEIAELIKYSKLETIYKKYTINSIYDKLEENTREKFYSLIKILGFMNKLKVERYEKNSISYRSIIDYRIIGIDNILPLINEYKFKNKFSLLIWNAICECNFNGKEINEWVLPNDGRHRYYDNNGPSTTVKALSSNPWLPDEKGTLYNPQDISFDMLPTEFKQNYNQKSNLLFALKFGENIRKKNQIQLTRYNAAAVLGLSEEQINTIDKAIENRIDIVYFLNEYINKINSNKETEDAFDPQKVKDQNKFPIGEINNLLSLQKNIKIEYINPNTKFVYYKEKKRHIRISRDRNNERTRIGGYYSSFCQLCGEKKIDWDVTQIFKIEKKDIGYKKELWYMNLSLCPMCARKYRKIRKRNFELMDSFKANIMDTNIINANPEKEIVIKLGDEQIRFRHDHLAEIQEILKLESENQTLNFPQTQP